MKESLKNKSVAILGLGSSIAEYTMARINSEQFDEIWGINSIGGIFHVNRTFMMDPASRFLDDEKAGTQTGIAREFLLETPNKGPIYSCQTDERVLEIVDYPLQDVVTSLGYCYFNNTVAYAVAFAIANQVKKISFYGIDFSYKKNIYFAEAGRACVEFWCAVAVTKGIAIQVAHSSSLLDTAVPPEEKLYGYHRLEDPLVQKFHEGSLIISNKSKMESPEPTDIVTEPVLIGRHDIEGVSYKKKENKNG